MGTLILFEKFYLGTVGYIDDLVVDKNDRSKVSVLVL